jgi:peptidoglycan/LPS O-acetylase OafA/YrhL
VPAWASELLLVAIVGVLALADRLPPTWPGLLVMALTVAYVACALGRRPGAPGPLARLMRTRPLMWLGTLSFTFYLLHGPVFWVMNNLARHALKWPEALVAGSWKPQATVAGAAGWTLLSLAVMLAVSHAVWRVYEVPAREAIRRWAARRLGRAQAPA